MEAHCIINGVERPTIQIEDIISPLTQNSIGKVSCANEEIINTIFQEVLKNYSKTQNYLFESNKITKIFQKWISLFLNPDESFTQYSVELVELMHNEIGKPIAECEIELLDTFDQVSWLISNLPISTTKNLEIDKNLWPTKNSKLIYQPRGIVLCIKPWNYPFQLPMWSITSALITGNSVVFKPSENSTLIGQFIIKSLFKAGLDNATLHFITGGADIGAKLVNTFEYDFITFTGSGKVGNEIQHKAFNKGIPSNMELGGNDPMIIFEDCNIELASNAILWGAFSNAGQVCTAAKKVFLHKDIFDDVLSLVIKKGEELEYEKDLSPVVSKKQLDLINGYRIDAIQKGAHEIKLKDNLPKNGFYFTPTILINVSNEMSIYREEAFGPIVPIIKWHDSAKIIKEVNSSEYGLGASIWTKNKKYIEQFEIEIEVGMIWINDVNLVFPQAPWMGWKKSGNGFELGKDGIRKYLRLKHISKELDNEKNRDWWYPY